MNHYNNNNNNDSFCRATMINRMLESIQLPLLLSSSVVPKQQITSIISSDHKLGTSNYKPLHTRPTGG